MPGGQCGTNEGTGRNWWGGRLLAGWGRPVLVTQALTTVRRPIISYYISAVINFFSTDTAINGTSVIW